MLISLSIHLLSKGMNQSIKLSLIEQDGVMIIFEPEHEKRGIISYVNREGQDQTARPRSLIRAFSVRRYIVEYPMNSIIRQRRS